MPIIYSYPLVTSLSDSDLMLITSRDEDDELFTGSVKYETLKDSILSSFGGTDNYIPKFYQGALVDSAIYQDGTNIGIGTTSPTKKLSVQGGGFSMFAVGGTAADEFAVTTHRYKFSDENEDIVYSYDSTNGHEFSTQGSPRVRITQAGNVGIGTQTPDTKLDVAGRAVIGTGNTLTNATNATVIGNSNNLTNDSIVDSNTNLILGDYGAGRYGNTVISDRTLRLGRADNIGATSSNTTGVLNFNDSVEANSAFSNVGGLVGYFPPPNTTNDYYFINAFSENVNGSAFATGASPTASRYNMSTSPSLSCIGQKFDANTTNGGAVYITASNNSPTPSSRGIFTFDARHQNQNYAAPDGHALFEVTSGYGQTKFIIKQVNGSSNVGIGVTSPASKLEVDGGDIEIDDSASGLILRSPNGTRYRVQVDNSGNLTTTAI